MPRVRVGGGEAEKIELAAKERIWTWKGLGPEYMLKVITTSSAFQPILG